MKLRQPLPEVLVRVRSADELTGVRALAGQLLDELNVKSVRFLDVNDDFVDYSVKPNLPRLGKRVGKLIPQLRAALEAIDGRVVAANTRAGAVTAVTLDGVTLELEPDDLLLDARSPEGYAAQEGRGYLVALDTRVTPELRREGLARDVVRLVQNGRKAAGLDVADRIDLSITGSGELAAAIAEHGAAIAREVLATCYALSAPAPGAYTEEHDLEGEELVFGLTKA